MPLPNGEHLRLCGRCDGRGHTGNQLTAYYGPCSKCGGSGFENATSAEARQAEIDSYVPASFRPPHPTLENDDNA